MADYCTLAEIKAQIPESIYATVTTYDASISPLITVASRMIDREMGRWDNFFAGSSETRYFDGTPEDNITIDEFVSVSAVYVSEQGGVASGDYTQLAATDFYPEPANATLNEKPYRRLVMDYINGAGLAWFPFRKAVKVVGVFGWSTTPPAEVKQACIIQVIRWLMRSKQMYQDTGGDIAVGVVLVKGQQGLDPDIRVLLYGIRMELQP